MKKTLLYIVVIMLSVHSFGQKVQGPASGMQEDRNHSGTPGNIQHKLKNQNVPYGEDGSKSVDPLGVTGVPTGVSCTGDCDGSVSITATGGTTPYSYFWSNSEVTQNLEGICPGGYTVTVTDASQATISGSWNVDEPGEISWVGSKSDVTCNGLCDGTLSTTLIAGGTPPYTYHWSNGATTPNISGLCFGNYSIRVIDAHNCDIRSFITVYQPAAIVINPTVIPASCPGAADGSISLTVSGGTPGYTYLWNTGSTTANIGNLVPAAYCVTVTDAHSCKKSGCYTVSFINQPCQNVFLQNQEIHDARCYNALHTIYLAGMPPDFLTTFVVASDGQVELIAGQNIIFYPGTVITGSLWGHIYTNTWCPAKEATVTRDPLPGRQGGDGSENTMFMVYPNPSNGNFTLVQKGGDTFGDVRVEVYRMFGDKLLTLRMSGEKQHGFSLSQYPAGLYLIQVTAGDHRETIRLVVTR